MAAASGPRVCAVAAGLHPLQKRFPCSWSSDRRFAETIDPAYGTRLRWPGRGGFQISFCGPYGGSAADRRKAFTKDQCRSLGSAAQGNRNCWITANGWQSAGLRSQLLLDILTDRNQRYCVRRIVCGRCQRCAFSFARKRQNHDFTETVHSSARLLPLFANLGVSFDESAGTVCSPDRAVSRTQSCHGACARRCCCSGDRRRGDRILRRAWH